MSQLLPTPHRMKGEASFRWRGGDVSRLEGLSDAVFALALTLLLVSLGVPETFKELWHAFRDLPVFLVCSAVLMWIWHLHFQFHRRYGLEDWQTIWLNALLLFVVVFYVYPLKYMFTTMWHMLLALDPEAWLRDVDGEIVRDAAGVGVRMLEEQNVPMLMLIYGLGFIGVFGTLALMTTRALRLREQLELDDREVLLTRAAIAAQVAAIWVGVLSLVLIPLGFLDGRLTGLSGMAYFLLGPTQWWVGTRWERRFERQFGQKP